ncbi:myosin-10-like [Macrobrachium rosenbergii]|uniref:myosin-10-like n=1 Tax=Macrobrachium rosenbergii TaxID=79674 RepID=UPI0034D79D37
MWVFTKDSVKRTQIKTNNIEGNKGVNSGLQVLDTFAAAVDSLEPGIGQEPNSLLAPDSAVAKPSLALLAGLALAVLWKCKSYGLKYHELSECMESELRDCEEETENHMSASESDFESDMTDSEDDLGPDMSESEDDLDMDMSDDDDDSETDMSLVSRLEDSLELEDSEDYLDTEMSQVSRLEDSLELEDTENDLETEISTEEEGEIEVLDQEIQLPRPRDQPDVEMQKLKEALENSQVYGSQMEQLWKEAMEKTAWLQNQLLDKDILLEKTAQEGAEMKSEIENLFLQKEQALTEKQRLEDDLKLAHDRGERTEKINEGLMEKTASLQQAMADKERELESAIQNGTMLGLKLKETEAINQVLASEKEYFDRLIEENRDALAKEERKAESLQELLARKAIESKKDQDKLRTLESQMTDIEGIVAELESQTMQVKENQVALQGKLELAESENSTLREVAADLRDRNRELEKNLAKETQKNSVLEDQVQLLESVLHQKEDRLVSAAEILNAEREKTEILRAELQTMKSWVSQLGEKARKITNDFEEEVQKRDNQIRDLLDLEENLKGEKLVLEDKLENAVNLLMNERMEKERENLHWHQKLQEKDQEVDALRKEEEGRREQRREMESKLRNLSRERNSLLREVEKQSMEYQLLIEEKEKEKTEMRMDYQETLSQKDSEIEKLRQGEEELLQLRKQCQKLKENLKTQEEDMITEQRRLRERQTRLEEALRDQDKYMLMTLLHGTAQRNFHLQQIALQHGNEILDSSEKERQEEDLFMRKEKQHEKYCDTQRERTNYSNQWEVLTHTLKDIVHGDERTLEATTGDSNNENLADKTCLQSNEDEMCKVEPLRAETHEQKEG